MTKVKLKDATKDLLKNAEDVLGNVSALRKKASTLVQAMRKAETKFQQEEEQRKADERKAEQQKLVSRQTKAYTMPDTDEVPESAPVSVPAAPAVSPVAEKEEAVAPKPIPESRPTASEAKETAAPAEALRQERLPDEKKSAEKAPRAEKTGKPEAKVQETVPEKKAEAGEPAKEVKAEVKPAKETPAKKEPVAEAQPVPQAAEGDSKIKTRVENHNSNERGHAQARTAPGAQHTAQQGQNRGTNPPQQGQFTRPANGQQGQYGRPANGQQGQYGRPANGQQGQYGRPANGQQGQYGRPANGQQGQYGRPTNGQQGQYGRPANGQPGQYGRPANGQQGQYGRPANGQQGQYGRPANGQQGQFGRPANGQQGAGRGQAGNGFGGNRSAGARKPVLDMTPSVEKERVSNYDPNKKSYIRQHDPERVAKNKKQLAKETRGGAYDDEVVRGRRSKAKKPSAQQLMAPIKIEKAYMTAERISIKDLTERIGKPAGEILKKLLLLGQTATINSELDFDTASLVCSDFGVELEMNLAKTAEDDLAETDYEDNEEDLLPRPPVVTIMGHVDHGKTSLLDYIRKTKVTSGEAGGITQHIGAYTVDLNGRSITFLDTPGHEAFTAMRARGAQSTDIAVLVVAADDGVMPQTIEAINHAKAAEVPIIVAINKMDKPTANPDRVKQDLTAYNLVPEEWGGETIMVPVSALTGDGVDDLLEMILLQADMLQLRANPNRMAKGVIIEAKLDKARGPLATVLLQNGTLHVGDNIVAGMASGRVRAMLNDKGVRVTEAGPSTPVEVSGFAEVPSAGDDMMAVADDHLGRQVVQERKDKAKAERNAGSVKVSLDNLFSRIDQSKLTNLNIVVKADVQGSVEAVKQAMEKLSNDEVRVRILHSAVGAITKDDVNLASAFDAIIIGFNIRPDAGAKEAAEHEGVDIRLYRVIYQAIEDIEKAMKGLLEPEFKEVLLGHAEVRNTFRITGAGTVAGCYVKDGKVQRNAQVRLLRDNVVVYEGKLSSLKRFKDDAKEVAEGYECGISFDNYNDIKEGDVIECFVLEEIEH